MIRDVVIHLLSDQPMLCDLAALPKPDDVSLVCTNVRTVDGKKPVSIDRSDSWFVYPFQVIRFVEVPLRAWEGLGVTDGLPALADATERLTADEVEEEAQALDEEPDEDLLRRIRDA